MTRKRQAALGMAVWLAVGIACSKPTKVEVKPGKVDIFTLDTTKPLIARVLDQKGQEVKKVKVEFQSSAPEIATVDKAGVVTAKGSGEAIVTARAGKLSGTATVRVKGVKDISLGLPESGAVGVAESALPLTVKITNEKGDLMDLEGAVIQSSMPNIASVDAKGVLTLHANGNTTITATMGKVTKDLPVPVEIEVAAAVKVDNASQSVAVGESHPLEFTLLSSRGRPMKTKITFVSSEPGVASVDDKGVVTGVAHGVATIAISAGDAHNEIKVTVR